MSELKVDYYYGAYGNTLLIRTNDVRDLVLLKDIFYKLSSNLIDEYNFKQIEGTKFVNIDDVVMTNRSTYVYIKEKKNIIYWEQTETDWYNCEGLMEGIIEGATTKKGGHQYFTGSEDGITVEISENEVFS